MRLFTRLAAVAALLAATPFALAVGAAEYTVVIDDMTFGEVPAELHVGDVIVWQNDDLFEHTATAEDGSFDVLLPAGSKVSWTVEAEGTFPFYCLYHPAMTGELVVLP